MAPSRNDLQTICEVVRSCTCVLVGDVTEALELALSWRVEVPRRRVITVANAGGFATSVFDSSARIPVWIDVGARP